MDFDFSDEQEQLRDAVRRWVDKGYDFERRRAIVAAGGFDRAAYGELAELGLAGLYVSEDDGGLGMGPVEGMVVMEELGRGIVLEPLTQDHCTRVNAETTYLSRALGMDWRTAENMIPLFDPRPLMRVVAVSQVVSRALAWAWRRWLAHTARKANEQARPSSWAGSDSAKPSNWSGASASSAKVSATARPRAPSSACRYWWTSMPTPYWYSGYSGLSTAMATLLKSPTL